MVGTIPGRRGLAIERRVAKRGRDISRSYTTMKNRRSHQQCYSFLVGRRAIAGQKRQLDIFPYQRRRYAERTVGTMDKMYCQVFKKAEIAGTSHMFRHKFSVELLKAGVEIRKVSKALGQKSVVSLNATMRSGTRHNRTSWTLIYHERGSIRNDCLQLPVPATFVTSAWRIPLSLVGGQRGRDRHLSTGSGSFHRQLWPSNYHPEENRRERDRAGPSRPS